MVLGTNSDGLQRDTPLKPLSGPQAFYFPDHSCVEADFLCFLCFRLTEPSFSGTQSLAGCHFQSIRDSVAILSMVHNCFLEFGVQLDVFLDI